MVDKPAPQSDRLGDRGTRICRDSVLHYSL